MTSSWQCKIACYIERCNSLDTYFIHGDHGSLCTKCLSRWSLADVNLSDDRSWPCRRVTDFLLRCTVAFAAHYGTYCYRYGITRLICRICLLLHCISLKSNPTMWLFFLCFELFLWDLCGVFTHNTLDFFTSIRCKGHRTIAPMQWNCHEG